MPRGIGVFNRTNGEFNGSEVWQDDLQKPEKIVALRHDLHDQDLADGIAECLVKDGSEPMLGALDMGGFVISQVGNPTLPDHAANLRQTITNATWASGSEQLTLIRGAGNIVVTIPLGGGGGGEQPLTGVQRIITGAGISFANGTEMSTSNPEDTISLTNTGVSPSSYSNPNITIDAQGRITSATNGNSVSTNLSITDRFASSFLLVSSTGSDVTMPQRTNTLAGLMTAGDFLALEDFETRIAELEAAGGGDMKPPLGLYGIPDAPKNDLIASVTGWIEPTSESTFGVTGWTSLRSETGEGIIDFLALRLTAVGTAGTTLSARLLIDGNVIWENTDFFSSVPTGARTDDVIFIGSADGLDAGGAASQAAFNSSWDIQVNTITSSNHTFDVYAKYQSDKVFVE